MSIKLSKSVFKSDHPFYPAFVGIADQTWGGKTDSAIQPIARILQQAIRDLSDLRDKYLKQYGDIQEDGPGYTIAGASKEDRKEFDQAMSEVFAGEVDLLIDEPISLVKRKQTKITPFQAAALEAVFKVTWPDDDGAHLNK